ncbi:molybdopterin molybdotransferase MoeA [Streptomyces himastatinicus]|uniref:molybdopterin molybdotransferase MoeA n=1 Tax=Streptomyces himastatinicus TaxID=998084 RepID=UPI0001B4B97F|nr:molybdopterin molybdotransferase MoeA [Streptomyces himastatinicus]
MTRRDPRSGDADGLDRQVDEALALANEKATAQRASPPPDVPDPELGWPPPSVARTIRHGAPDNRKAPPPVPDDALGWPPPTLHRPEAMPPEGEPTYPGGGGVAGAGALDADVDVWRRGLPDDSALQGSRRRRHTVQDPRPGDLAPAPDNAPDAHPPEAPLTAWPDARRIAARAARAAPARAAAPVLRALDDALGHVLAEPLTALTDLPPFDTSAMDGWALAGPGPWRLTAGRSGRGILAGTGVVEPLSDGHAVQIATGARIPPGATAVLRSEYGADTGDGWLYAAKAPQPVGFGQDIRPRGQECRSGDLLLPAGTRVTPAVLGLAAAAGYDELATVRRPRVEVLVLGDELLHRGLPREGGIRDALGPMLGPWLRALGAEVSSTRRIADEADALYAAIDGSSADLVVTTGGTAAGPVDHVHPTLHRLGAELLVDGVEVRPGHPMLLARLAPERHLVGLPGNPLAAVSGLLTLAEPLLRTLTGRPEPERRPAPLAEAVSGHPHNTRLVPVTFRYDEARPLRFSGPAMLRGVAVADALAVIPPGGAGRGTEVEVLELPWSSGTGGTGGSGQDDDDDGIPTQEGHA